MLRESCNLPHTHLAIFMTSSRPDQTTQACENKMYGMRQLLQEGHGRDTDAKTEYIHLYGDSHCVTTFIPI